MYETGKISFKGILEDGYYEQVITGIKKSELIDGEVKEKIIETFLIT